MPVKFNFIQLQRFFTFFRKLILNTMIHQQHYLSWITAYLASSKAILDKLNTRQSCYITTSETQYRSHTLCETSFLSTFRTTLLASSTHIKAAFVCLSLARFFLPSLPGWPEISRPMCVVAWRSIVWRARFSHTEGWYFSPRGFFRRAEEAATWYYSNGSYHHEFSGNKSRYCSLVFDVL